VSHGFISNWKAGLAGLAGMALASSAFGIQTAGTLFVDLDARHISAGSLAWANGGSLGGSFAENGNPLAANLGPQASAAVSFDGVNDFYRGPAAPIGLTGAGAAGTRSIEVWAFNPAIAGEESVVSLAKRGGPGGSNVGFNYGGDAGFGAVGHWAGSDIGWNGTPPAGQWHHLVYTFDGTDTRVYADGVLKNIENSTVANGGVPLDAHDGIDMLIASQMEPNGTTPTGPLRGSLSLGQVRIHDGVLSDTQVLQNFAEEVGRFAIVNNSPTPIHRYSFDGSGGIGATLTDSIGGAHGVLRGADSSALTGTGQLNLGGGSSATAGYGDLPNGLISGLTNTTLEGWATWENAGQNWTRLFDFGDNTAGEVTGPGGSFSGNGPGGDGYFFLTPGNGTGGNMLTGIYEPGPGETQVPAGFRAGPGIEHHYAVVFDDTNDLLQLYFDGILVGQGNIAGRSLGQILDINNWLGRSNFDGDANFDGLFNEFRIYNQALTGSQVLGNFAAGPNALNIAAQIPEPASMALGLLGMTALALRRRRAA